MICLQNRGLLIFPFIAIRTANISYCFLNMSMTGNLRASFESTPMSEFPCAQSGKHAINFQMFWHLAHAQDTNVVIFYFLDGEVGRLSLLKQ